MTESNKTTKDFRVVRQDTHGNQFSLKENLSESGAKNIAKEYSKKPHHQTYWAQAMSIPLKNLSL